MDPSIFEKLNALQNMQRQRQAAEQHEEQARLNQNLQSELLAIKRQIKRQLEVEKISLNALTVEEVLRLAITFARTVLGKLSGLVI